MEARYPRATVISLALAVGALASASGLFAAQYASRRGDVGQLRQQIAATQGSIAVAEARRATVASSVDELNTAWSQLQATNTTLHKCADQAKASVAAADANDQAALQLAVQALASVCGR